MYFDFKKDLPPAASALSEETYRCPIDQAVKILIQPSADVVPNPARLNELLFAIVVMQLNRALLENRGKYRHGDNPNDVGAPLRVEFSDLKKGGRNASNRFNLSCTRTISASSIDVMASYVLLKIWVPTQKRPLL